MESVGEARASGYWRANIRLISILLAIWAFVSYGAGYLLAGPLNTLTVGNVPLPFWMVQQGAIVIFVVLIFVYAKVMDKIDKKFECSQNTKEHLNE
jgi:putative solute:sodium symporter small subunit